ncbi:MAG: type IIA DNA topoisomerase subunit B [Catenulispora sp.]|nr:type IIA DNA topoisomerase subunit B [Catenulispora sp.]
MSAQGRPAPSADKDGSYTARHLLVLEGLDAVRKRPGMYIGSNDGRGLMHCLWEIIDNSVDEALAGFGDDIEIILHKDGSAEVRDNGRGIPVDVEPKTGLSGVEVVMTMLHAGGKFGGGSYAASGGLHGVGASVVNALSSRVDIEVDRAGSVHAMSFQRGVPGVFAGDGPDSKFRPESGLRKVGRVSRAKGASQTGTRTRFWPDKQIFLKDAEFVLEDLHARARQTAFLVPGLTIKVVDERDGGHSEEVFSYAGGISEFVEFLAPDRPITDTLRFTGSGKFTETVPVLDEQGHMTPADIERELTVDVALRWGTEYDTVIRSFVNIIATPKGGTHLVGFGKGLLKAANEQLRATKLLKVNDDDVIREDVFEGLTAVVTVRLAEPQFEGQTKEVLGTPAANRIVARVVENSFKEFLTSAKRGDKPMARAVLEKIANAARTRITARQHKEAQRRKNALETSALPAKLADCRSDDVDRSEMFIIEGDSAMGSAKAARNSEFQALLPIRGKILNVQKSSIADMLKNAECAAIIQVVGAGSGRSFDLDQARYGKVILMADADVDGSHIRCLLLTLFHRYMRPMLEAGRVYAAVPPLHRIEVIGAGRAKNEFIYTYSDNEMKRTVAELLKKGKRIKEPIQRYKGLGEMDADQLAETTMDPRHRTLRRITVADAESADKAFDLLMGNDVAPRREFIINSAAVLDRSRIDV